MKKLLLSLLIGLLSCISFSSASSIISSNNFQINSPYFYSFNVWNDLQDNSITDGFICIVVPDNKQVGVIDVSDSYGNKYLQVSTQASYNTNNVPVCTYLPDFSLNYTLQAIGEFQTVYYYYMYAVQTPLTPPVSCYTGVMNIRLVNGNNNSVNDLYYEFSPYVQYQARYTIYYSGVNTTTMQDGVLFEGNDCSSIQSDLNTCSTNFQSCQGYLNTCQTDYSSCSSSLSSCQSDLNSASGYVSSLEGEIAQCTQDLINCSNSSSGSGDCGSGTVQWSALYVNDIQHLGKPNIFINIPDVIDWDYISTGDNFTLNVSGYAVDTEYIEGVIAVNSYQPTSEDFTNIFVSGLTLVFPYIVIVLFIVFVRKLIKKIFK